MRLKTIILRNYCLLKGIPEDYGEEKFLKEGYQKTISIYEKHLEQHIQYLKELEKAQEKDYLKVVEENSKEKSRKLEENSLNHLKLIEKQKEVLNKTDFSKIIKSEQIGKDPNYTLQDAVLKTIRSAENYHKDLLDRIERQRQDFIDNPLSMAKSLKEEKEKTEQEINYFKKKIKIIKDEVEELKRFEKELDKVFDFTEV